jgi:hypothetical protein
MEKLVGALVSAPNVVENLQGAIEEQVHRLNPARHRTGFAAAHGLPYTPESAIPTMQYVPLKEVTPGNVERQLSMSEIEGVSTLVQPGSLQRLLEQGAQEFPSPARRPAITAPGTAGYWIERAIGQEPIEVGARSPDNPGWHLHLSPEAPSISPIPKQGTGGQFILHSPIRDPINPLSAATPSLPRQTREGDYKVGAEYFGSKAAAKDYAARTGVIETREVLGPPARMRGPPSKFGLDFTLSFIPAPAGVKGEAKVSFASPIEERINIKPAGVLAVRPAAIEEARPFYYTGSVGKTVSAEATEVFGPPARVRGANYGYENYSVPSLIPGPTGVRGEFEGRLSQGDYPTAQYNPYYYGSQAITQKGIAPYRIPKVTYHKGYRLPSGTYHPGDVTVAPEPLSPIASEWKASAIGLTPAASAFTQELFTSGALGQFKYLNMLRQVDMGQAQKEVDQKVADIRAAERIDTTAVELSREISRKRPLHSTEDIRAATFISMESAPKARKAPKKARIAKSRYKTEIRKGGKVTKKLRRKYTTLRAVARELFS